MRLNKFLSSRGSYSRRAVDKLIQAERISINGKTAKLGDKVSDGDEIKVQLAGTFAADKFIVIKNVTKSSTSLHNFKNK